MHKWLQPPASKKTKKWHRTEDELWFWVLFLSSVWKKNHVKCDEDEGLTCSKCGKLQTLVSLISNKLWKSWKGSTSNVITKCKKKKTKGRATKINMYQRFESNKKVCFSEVEVCSFFAVRWGVSEKWEICYRLYCVVIVSEVVCCGWEWVEVVCLMAFLGATVFPRDLANERKWWW